MTKNFASFGVLSICLCFGIVTSFTVHKNKLSPVRIPLVNDNNETYMLVVSLGNPLQTFKLNLDIDGQDFHVPSVSCGHQCNNHTLYDSTKSNTYKKDGRPVSTRGGSGILSIDTMTIGDLLVKGQTFGEYFKISDDYFSLEPYDGHIFLTPQLIFHDNATTPFHNIINHMLLPEPTFSLYLKDTPLGSELILGGTHKEFYKGELAYASLTSNTEWEVQLDAVQVRASEVNTKIIAKTCETKCKSGLSLLDDFSSGPKDQLKIIAKALGAKYNTQYGYHFESCTPASMKSMPNLEFVFGGKPFVMTPKMYILDNKVGDCFLRFSNNSVDRWILRKSFIDSVYSYYDLGNKRVGFAEAV